VIRHTITRFRITLEVLEAVSRSGTPRAGAHFVDENALAGLALPAPHRKLAQLVFRARGRA
jgi:hypothetical protein